MVVGVGVIYRRGLSLMSEGSTVCLASQQPTRSPRRFSKDVLFACLLLLSTSATLRGGVAAADSPTFGDSHFKTAWERTDRADVVTGARSYMWGPQPDTPPMIETFDGKPLLV